MIRTVSEPAAAIEVKALRKRYGDYEALRGIVSEDGHLAAGAVAVALEDLDRRRLAGAVRPEQPEHLAFVDREVDPPDRLEVPVGLAKAADLDRMHPWRSVDGARRYSRAGEHVSLRRRRRLHRRAARR